MKSTILFALALVSVPVTSYAFPENLKPGMISSFFYDGRQECPETYCEYGDDGFSMRNWCDAHRGVIGSDPIVVGWAVVNGFSCFCGCNRMW